MEWRDVYLDLSLVPMALLSSLFYHFWLWYIARTQPNRTYIAMNALGQRAWVDHMIKVNYIDQSAEIYIFS